MVIKERFKIYEVQSMSIKWNRCNRCGLALKKGQERFCDKCKRIIASRKTTHRRMSNNRGKDDS